MQEQACGGEHQAPGPCYTIPEAGQCNVAHLRRGQGAGALRYRIAGLLRHIPCRSVFTEKEYHKGKIRTGSRSQSIISREGHVRIYVLKDAMGNFVGADCGQFTENTSVLNPEGRM